MELVYQQSSEQYDDVVSQLTYTSALQSWGFGEARSVLGQQPLRFLIQKNGKTVGAIQLLRKPLVSGLSLLYAPRGACFDDVATLEDLPKAIQKIAKNTDLSIKIEPPYPYAAEQENSIPEKIAAWQRCKPEQPEHTLALDLTLPEDTLFKNLHEMTRRNVKASVKNGVQTGRDEAFEDFWQVFTATNERSKLGQFPKNYYTHMYHAMNQHAGSEAYVVLARHQERALAGGFFVGLGKGVYYLYGGSIKDDRLSENDEPRKDVRAPTAFYWNAILDAKKRGYTFFDTWGIPTVLDESKHSFGVAQMKLRLGGFRLWYPAYEYSLSPLSGVVRQALALRRKLNNYRKRGSTDDIL